MTSSSKGWSDLAAPQSAGTPGAVHPSSMNGSNSSTSSKVSQSLTYHQLKRLTELEEQRYDTLRDATSQIRALLDDVPPAVLRGVDLIDTPTFKQLHETIEALSSRRETLQRLLGQVQHVCHQALSPGSEGGGTISNSSSSSSTVQHLAVQHTHHQQQQLQQQQQQQQLDAVPRLSLNGRAASASAAGSSLPDAEAAPGSSPSMVSSSPSPAVSQSAFTQGSWRAGGAMPVGVITPLSFSTRSGTSLGLSPAMLQHAQDRLPLPLEPSGPSTSAGSMAVWSQMAQSSLHIQASDVTHLHALFCGVVGASASLASRFSAHIAGGWLANSLSRKDFIGDSFCLCGTARVDPAQTPTPAPAAPQVAGTGKSGPPAAGVASTDAVSLGFFCLFEGGAEYMVMGCDGTGKAAAGALTRLSFDDLDRMHVRYFPFNGLSALLSKSRGTAASSSSSAQATGDASSGSSGIAEATLALEFVPKQGSPLVFWGFRDPREFCKLVRGTVTAWFARPRSGAAVVATAGRADLTGSPAGPAVWPSQTAPQSASRRSSLSSPADPSSAARALSSTPPRQVPVPSLSPKSARLTPAAAVAAQRAQAQDRAGASPAASAPRSGSVFGFISSLFGSSDDLPHSSSSTRDSRLGSAEASTLQQYKDSKQAVPSAAGGRSLPSQQAQGHHEGLMLRLEDAMLQFRQLLEPWNGAWRVLCSDDGVAVFERPVKGGPAVHKCVASFEAPPALVFWSHHHLINRMQWDETVTPDSYVLERVDAYTDVLYTHTAGLFNNLVSAREYIDVRRWAMLSDGSFIVWFGGLEDHPDAPVKSGVVRGLNGACGVLYEPIDLSDPSDVLPAVPRHTINSVVGGGGLSDSDDGLAHYSNEDLLSQVSGVPGAAQLADGDADPSRTIRGLAAHADATLSADDTSGGRRNLNPDHAVIEAVANAAGAPDSLPHTPRSLHSAGTPADAGEQQQQQQQQQLSDSPSVSGLRRARSLSNSHSTSSADSSTVVPSATLTTGGDRPGTSATTPTRPSAGLPSTSPLSAAGSRSISGTSSHTSHSNTVRVGVPSSNKGSGGPAGQMGCRVTLIVQTDARGMLPQRNIDKAITRLLIAFPKRLRSFIKANWRNLVRECGLTASSQATGTSAGAGNGT